jgi:hypothetical protein
MLKFAVALALAAGLAAPAALADGPKTRNGQSLRGSPTDEYVPPQTRRLPRGGSEDTRLATIFAPDTPRLVARTRGRVAAYSYLPAHPSRLAPGSGPPARTAISRETRYFYQPPLSADFDGAPCPTRSRDSLGELFACTLR